MPGFLKLLLTLAKVNVCVHVHECVYLTVSTYMAITYMRMYICNNCSHEIKYF